MAPVTKKIQKKSKKKCNNGWILFCARKSAATRKRFPLEKNFGNISKILGQIWKDLPDDTKEIWHERARAQSAEPLVRFIFIFFHFVKLSIFHMAQKSEKPKSKKPAVSSSGTGQEHQPINLTPKVLHFIFSFLKH